MEDKQKLHIPAGIKAEKDVYDGYNGKAIRNMVICGLVWLFFMIAFGLLFNALIPAFLGVVFGGFVILMLFRAGEDNMSMVDLARIWLRFIRGQKKYSYHRINEWDSDDWKI